ncbi:MAG: PAS domain S-box protein [bacterium]
MSEQKKILIVEDDDIVAMELSNQLNEFGYAVCDTINYGEDAVKQVHELYPDLILMDIKLKGKVDGIKAAESINKKYDLPIVFLTAYSDESTVNRVKNADPYGYLIKPYTKRELKSTLEIALYKYETQKRIRQNEKRLSITLKCIGDAVISTDVQGNITFMNPMAERLSGWSLKEVYKKHLTDYIKIISEKDRKPVESPIKQVIEQGIIWNLANHTLLISKDNKEIPIDNSVAAIKDDDGNVNGMVLVFKDVSERKENEKKMLRLNRSIKALGACNRSLVRANKEETLLRDICNLLVGIGGYKFVWVGFPDKNDKDKIIPVAQAGEDNGYLDSLDWDLITYSGKKPPPPLKAFVNSKMYIQNLKCRVDDKVQWKQVAAKCGFCWSISLPLIYQSEKLGVLDICSADINGYDEEEVKLIGEMADDLAFGITTLRTAKAKKETERQLKESEEKYRTLTENVNIGIYRNEPGEDGTFIEVNSGMLTIFGYKDKDEFLKQKVSSLYQKPEDREFIENILKNFGFIKDEIIFLRRKDGTPIICSVTATAIRNENNEIKFYDGVLEDITEKRKSEEALQESEEKYRLLVENTGEGIIIIDRNQTVLFSNKAGGEIFGVNEKEFVGQNVKDYMSAETYKFFVKQIEIRKSAGTHSYEIEINRPDGENRQVIITATPHFDQAGNFIEGYAIVRDITDRVNSEQENERIKAQLIQAQKMEAIGVLTGGIAHDFNNILTAIQVSMDLALMQVRREEDVYSDLMEVKKCTNRASRLIRQLLHFSRKHPMEYKVFDANILIDNLSKMLYRVIGEDIKVSVQLADGLWKLYADQGTIEQVLMNLAVNSKDAMPDGGELVITTENLTIKDKNINLPEFTPEKFVCITLKDNGIGMSKKTREHIFDPFFSTKEPGKGTGLGLSVVYGIIKQHNGWIDVESELSKGTTFKIYLPAASEEAKHKYAEKHVYDNRQKGQGEVVLIIEDQDKVREFTSHALERNGYKVFTAADGCEAEKIFSQKKDELDLVLSDVVLPDTSGITIVEDFQKKRPDIAILLSSGYTDHKSRWPTIMEKGYLFLEKPYTLNDLLNKVYEAIHKDDN